MAWLELRTCCGTWGFVDGVGADVDVPAVGGDESECGEVDGGGVGLAGEAVEELDGGGVDAEGVEGPGFVEEEGGAEAWGEGRDGDEEGRG